MSNRDREDFPMRQFTLAVLAGISVTVIGAFVLCYLVTRLNYQGKGRSPAPLAFTVWFCYAAGGYVAGRQIKKHARAAAGILTLSILPVAFITATWLAAISTAFGGGAGWSGAMLIFLWLGPCGFPFARLGANLAIRNSA